MILVISIFWFCLYRLGFPQPMGDDLFFIGAAINLAKTGELTNPWLSMWSEQTVDRFFVQPPFHSYTLAGWITLFGNSTDSLLLFQCTCYCLFSIFAALILRKYKFSELSIYCIPLVYTTWMAIAGLRQDALGMAYLAIGLWALIHDSALRYFWASLFLGLAICTSPVLLAYAVPFSLGIAIANLHKNSKLDWHYFLRRILALLSAIFIVSLLLLWAIDFQLFHFLDDLSWHASFRVVPLDRVIPEAMFIVTTGYGEIIYGSLYTTYLILLFFLIKNRKKSNTRVIYFAFLLNLALGINMILYVSTLYYNFNFFCWLGVVILLFEISFDKIVRITLAFLCLVVFLIYQSQLIVGVISQNHPPNSKYESTLQWVKENPDRNYAIDDVAARVVFDYNLPNNSIAWNFSNNPEIFWPESVREKPLNTVWIISPAKAALTLDLPDYERVKLFGRTFNSIPRSPYDVTIVE